MGRNKPQVAQSLKFFIQQDVFQLQRLLAELQLNCGYIFGALKQLGIMDLVP